MTTETRELPISFSGPLVRAILERRKSVTRRIVKPQPEHGVDAWTFDPSPTGGWCGYLDGRLITVRGSCPYGRPGDVLYVKERWSFADRYDHLPPRDVLADDHPYWDLRWFAADHEDGKGYCGHDPVSGYRPGRWRSARFMPKWAARLWLQVEDVRVERVQEITSEDARAEGFRGGHDAIPGYQYSATPIEHFRHAWNEINGKRFPRESNPHVWVVEFSKLEGRPQ